MTTNQLPEPAGAIAITERALGPDLARGFMLLFIALANSHYFLQGDSVLGGFPRGGSAIDSAVTWFIATFVDGRAFPMFGLLFGYGVAQIVRRNAALGPRGVRRMLWRRSAVLIGVGFLHAMLLYVGDILAAYGVLLLLGAWMVRWRERWLLVIAALVFALTAMPSGDSMAISAEPPDPSMLPHGIGELFSDRIVAQPFIMLLGPIGFVVPFVIGLMLGRRRILENPDRHRGLLRAMAIGGIGAAVLGAQPVALMLAGWTAVPGADTLHRIGPLHDASGVLGGFGYAALIALVATRLTDRRHPVVAAIAATGQRSMTCYLAQSVVWTIAFTPFLLDLSVRLGVAGTALLATATWAATVLIADRMRRAEYRGPFELLVRRVTYRGISAAGESATARPGAAA